MATSEKEKIDQKTKLCLNKITELNYDSIKEQVAEIFLSAGSEEDENLFIKVFFLKACHEEKYTELYIDLVKFLVRMKESRKTGKKYDSKLHIKWMKDDFVKKIQNQFKEVFNQIFDEYKIDPKWNEEDIMDYEHKHKKKLFGNLNFIAALVKNKMLNKKVPFYVLESLLEKSCTKQQGENKLNTFEGTCKFLGQIASKID